MPSLESRQTYKRYISPETGDRGLPNPPQSTKLIFWSDVSIHRRVIGGSLDSNDFEHYGTCFCSLDLATGGKRQ
jgi:hypothetical protein